MAAKYWYVAGNGSGTWATAANWYNGSGGTGGTTTVPTSADDVIIDAASGSGTLTIGTTSACQSLNTSTSTGTLAGASGLTITSAGGVILNLGGTLTHTGVLTIIGTGGTVAFNGRTKNSAIGITTTGTVTCIDTFTCTGILTLRGGSLTGTTISVGSFTSIFPLVVRSLSCTNLYLTGTGTVLSITIANQANLTWSCTNIYMVDTAVALTKTITLNDAVCCTNVYVQGTGSSAINVTSSSTALIKPNVYVSKTGGGTFTNTTSTFNSLIFVTGTDINYISVSTTTIVTDYILCNSMTLSTNNALTFNGTTCSFITANKTFSNLLTITGTSYLTVTGDYTTSSIQGSSISITVSAGATFNGQVATGGGIIISTPTFKNNVIFNGEVWVTLNMTITNSNVSTNAYMNVAGAFVFNSGTLNMSGRADFLTFNSSNTNVRTLIASNFIFITGASSSAWNMSVVTNLTYDFTGSNIILVDGTSSLVTFIGGGLTYNDLTISRSSISVEGDTSITGSNTFNIFTDETFLPHKLIFSPSQTQTVNDFIINGGGIGTPLVSIVSSSVTTNATINKLGGGRLSFTNLAIQRITATPDSTWYASDSIDLGNNKGWIFGSPIGKLSALGVG